jgi:hypothetical protein
MAVSREKFIVDEKGKKTAVILPLRRYRKMLEDLHDLAVVAERRAEKSIPLEEMKRRLKKDGLV